MELIPMSDGHDVRSCDIHLRPLARATRLIGGLATASILLMGCTQSAPDDPPTESSIPDGPVIVPSKEITEMAASGVTGVLTLKDNCLYFGETLVVWPAGTTWDGASDSVVFADGNRLKVGETTTGGGGPVVDPVAYVGQATADRLADCDSSADVLYYSPSD